MVVKSGVMDVASDIAELMSLQDGCMDAYLVGRYEGDCVFVDTVSREDVGSVGLCISNEEGGLEPDDSVRMRLSDMHPRAVLMMIDPYACEIAVYRMDGGDLVHAKVMIME